VGKLARNTIKENRERGKKENKVNRGYGDYYD
jgi:hypothetical protein